MKKEEQNVVNLFYKEVDSINLSGNSLKTQSAPADLFGQVAGVIRTVLK